jgi:hypothetical protein
MPNTRDVLKRVEHVTAMIEADCGNAGNGASVRELLILNWVMKAPTRTFVGLKGALGRDAHRCADGE